MALVQELGFAINYNKVCVPSIVLTLLWVEINSVSYSLALPPAKMAALQEKMAASLGCRKITKRHLQSAARKLNWGAQVIHGRHLPPS
jgi:hypothetical protein